MEYLSCISHSVCFHMFLLVWTFAPVAWFHCWRVRQNKCDKNNCTRRRNSPERESAARRDFYLRHHAGSNTEEEEFPRIETQERKTAPHLNKTNEYITASFICVLMDLHPNPTPLWSPPLETEEEEEEGTWWWRTGGEFCTDYSEPQQQVGL